MTQPTRLPIGQYVIKADATGWVYGKPKMAWNKARERDEEIFPKGRYTGTLSAALTGLLELVLHESAAQSIKDIRQEINDFKAEISELFEISE